MRPRTEAALGAGILLVLGVGAALLGSREGRNTDDDARASTYLTGALGASGYAEALTRLGVRVERSRARTRETVMAIRADSGARHLLAVLGPANDIGRDEAVQIAELAASGRADLLIAGAGAAAIAECFGWRILPVFPAVPVSGPGLSDVDGTAAGEAVRVRFRLEPVAVGEVGGATTEGAARRGAFDDGTGDRCPERPARAVDTLLRTPGGVAAVRVALDSAVVTLLADQRLVTNRALRETAAGPFALRIATERTGVVTFDEFHHGFHAGGSLLGALLSWSTRSPAGWALWQLGIVALVALGAAAVRFGPARPIVSRARRSPLEHVRALATALSAARGHDVAVRLIVLGLRRRLARPGDPPRADARAWLEQLAAHARTPASRHAVATLRRLTDGPQGAHAVREAADAVEDVWLDLKPR